MCRRCFLCVGAVGAMLGRCALLASLAAPAAAIGMLPKGFKVPDTVKDHFAHWSKPELWTVTHKAGGVNEKGYPITNTTYRSPVVKLMTGESAFTLNPVTSIPFPEGDYTILRADFRLLDGTGSANVPLSEVYNHHWLIGTTTSVNPLDACEDNLFFGAGAEMHGMPTVFQNGLGMMRIGAKGKCGGNLHFIRTEDLATSWSGKNNPNGDLGAAVKNCIECGFAPGRATECIGMLDGTYGCCLGGARCPVNHPEDKSTKSYYLEYQVVWTRDLTSTVLGGGGVLDVSEVKADAFAEWNVAPHLKSLKNQVCSDTVCNATQSWKVEGQKGFGDGICPGEMVWSYLHQHTGAIKGTMFINGKKICSSEPVIGTDPNNAVGNEKGYLVSFYPCIDRDNIWKVPDSRTDTVRDSVRINMGDVVTVECLYDVDVKSTRNLPMPGGKHGGVMGLYFYSMVCDPGTFFADYSCRQGACIPVSPGKGQFKNLDACKAGLGSDKCNGAVRYHCDTATATCLESPEGHSTMAKCQEACGAVPPAPPGVLYKCQDGVCAAGGTVDLDTCQLACG